MDAVGTPIIIEINPFDVVPTSCGCRIDRTVCSGDACPPTNRASFREAMCKCFLSLDDFKNKRICPSVRHYGVRSKSLKELDDQKRSVSLVRRLDKDLFDRFPRRLRLEI